MSLPLGMDLPVPLGDCPPVTLPEGIRLPNQVGWEQQRALDTAISQVPKPVMTHITYWTSSESTIPSIKTYSYAPFIYRHLWPKGIKVTPAMIQEVAQSMVQWGRELDLNDIQHNESVLLSFTTRFWSTRSFCHRLYAEVVSEARELAEGPLVTSHKAASASPRVYNPPRTSPSSHQWPPADPSLQAQFDLNRDRWFRLLEESLMLLDGYL